MIIPLPHFFSIKILEFPLGLKEPHLVVIIYGTISLWVLPSSVRLSIAMFCPPLKVFFSVLLGRMLCGVVIVSVFSSLTIHK